MGGVPVRFAAFVSGQGRTVQNLAKAIEQGRLPGELALVVASRECPGAAWARGRGIETFVQRGPLTGDACLEMLEGARAQWGVLGGYTRLLPIPAGWENRFVNIHPALLPSFGGKGMHGLKVHQAVLDAGCRVTGCTVHLCDGTYDTGPIVAQRCCVVREGDTPETLGERVFEVECAVYPEALAALFEARFSIVGRRVRIIG